MLLPILKRKQRGRKKGKKRETRGGGTEYNYTLRSVPTNHIESVKNKLKINIKCKQI